MNAEGVFFVLYGKLYSACLYGIDGVLIEVEVDISSGLPMVSIIGLPDTAVREAVERVRSAVKNCGYSFPLQRITINLAPADLRKEGSAFDLAIALGLLQASEQIRLPDQEKLMIIGELSLDGGLRPVTGVLPMVDLARRKGFESILLPADNAREALLLEGIKVYGIRHLKELEFLSTDKEKHKPIHQKLSPVVVSLWSKLEVTAQISGRSVLNEKRHNTSRDDENYSDVLGQRQMKRAMVLAAAGMHNLILIGPPGTGKTMLIRRLPGIMPELSKEEALAVTKIYSAAGQVKEFAHGLLRKRAFRAPHHTISSAGLIGGGGIPKPGEVSLAHKGVLFLDELPEFSRHVLEVLRQPLEERTVSISRSKASFTYPAHFLLAASMNPCHCGFLGSEPPLPACTCTPWRVNQYRSRISGPLLDRIDLQLEVPRTKEWLSDERPVSSEMMKEQVLFAQERQQHRLRGTGLSWNSELSGTLLRESVKLHRDAELLMRTSFEQLGLSMRAYDRIIKLGRTIADLEDREQVFAEHIAEAIQYRQLDQKTYFANYE